MKEEKKINNELFPFEDDFEEDDIDDGLFNAHKPDKNNRSGNTLTSLSSNIGKSMWKQSRLNKEKSFDDFVDSVFKDDKESSKYVKRKIKNPEYYWSNNSYNNDWTI